MPKQIIQEIYNLFKPLPQTSVWGDDEQVCVSWEYVRGYNHWYVKDDELLFEYVESL